MSGYRIYRWGQCVDIYNGDGSLWVESWPHVATLSKCRPCMAECRLLATRGSVYHQNWLVCRDELIDLGFIEG